ncbi:MAG TPA: nitroreductase [Candidatus Avibacteroides excrementipullorum]|jgi:nitroreductase|nr:nitroreductase [Candidatus Avibacteroides excrementipullorum]
MKKIFFMAALAAMTLASCTGGASGEQKEAAVQQKNEVIETIMSRRSIRQYKDMPVERTKMDTILMCGINAPNGMNRQSWEIRVVGKEYIDGVTKLYVEENPDAAKDPSFKNIFRNAPVAVLVAADTEYELSQIDCGLLGENMMLSAWSMGIGSCCLGSPVRFLKSETAKEFYDKLQFSDGYELVYAIGFGYPDEAPAAKPRDAQKIKYVD